MNFQEQYTSLSDEELLHVAGDRKDLTEEAAFALDAEMARRGLSYEQARAKQRDELLLEIMEARAHHPKRNKSKYLASHISLRIYFVGLVGLLLLMFLTLRPHALLYEWSESICVAYVGALVALSAVKPWVRQTLNFWVSVAIACIPQLIVSHWLAVYHPAQSRSGGKGSWLLSILAGYVVGCGVFLLLQKLKPVDETKTTP